MQVAGGRRSRSSKTPHCSINKNKQRERKGKEKEKKKRKMRVKLYGKTTGKKIKWLLRIGGCYLLLLVSC